MTTRSNTQKTTMKLCFSALYLAIALVLPFLTGQIPQIGSMLCPMHIPALLCGFLCGWPWGLAVGFIAPILRSLLFGMPPMIPGAVSMAFEMATYGAIAGLLYKKLPDFKGRLYAILVSSMVAGRVVWGLVRFIMTGLTATKFSMEAFIAGAITQAVPGIILQLVIIPALVIVLTKAGLNLNKD